MYAGGDRRQFSSSEPQHAKAVTTVVTQLLCHGNSEKTSSLKLSLHLVTGTILSAHLNQIQFHTCESSQIWFRAEDRIQNCLMLNKISFTVAMSERKHF